MFTLAVYDEKVSQQLMARVKQRGESLDDALRKLLDEKVEAVEETPARKLLRLIDAADLEFTNPFNGRDASETLRREAGAENWRDERYLDMIW
jgi:plasmid stability protein